MENRIKGSMTYNEGILHILSDGKRRTCQEICRELVKHNIVKESKQTYLSGSISSKLNKMTADKIVDREENFGKRGGYGYQIISGTIA